MAFNCPKCKTPTERTREITSKKDGKHYTVYICESGCKSDDQKYSFSFFPPKVQVKQHVSTERAKPLVGTDEMVIRHLRSIDATLAKMLQHMIMENDELEKVSKEFGKQ